MTLVNAINLKTGDVAEFDLINIKTSGNYKGLWDASTNTPFLTNGVGTEGDWYEVSVGGTVNFGAGDFVFSEGDTVSYIDGNWEKASEKIIDDSQISYNKTWSSAKIKEEIDVQVPLIVEEKVEEGLAGKQDLLTEDQLKAVNSGITAEKVADYDGLSTDINNLSTEVATNKTDIATLKTDVGDIGDSITDLRNDKQDKLTETQLQAVDSGITSEKVLGYDTAVSELAELKQEVTDIDGMVAENGAEINALKTDKNDVFQVSTVPLLTDVVPNPFQYIGETEGGFIKGHFYEKTETDFTQWERTDNQTYVVTMADAVVDDGVYQADGKTVIGTITEISDDAMTYTDTDGQSVSTTYHSVFHSTGYEEIYDLEKYQIKLTAGNNITITEDGVISATGGGTGSNIASDITYDNATSGLTADNVQSAIDELSVEKLDKTTDVANAGKSLVVGDDGAIRFGEVSGKTYTTLEELGLDASATLNDAIVAMPFGSSALLGVTMFTDYQNIFPYTESDDQYSRVYIVKSNSLSRVYVVWFKKDGTKSAIANVDGNNKVVGWNNMLTDKSPVLKTYISIAELNTAKGTSISLVAGTDNTQTIIDVLGPSEQFIDWFGNPSTNKRFGINNVDFGDNINLLKIIKYNSTDAVAIAYMDSGAVLNRFQKNGVLGDWVNIGHVNKDGYEDDGTLAICGDTGEVNTGVYGNGKYYADLGLSNDIMTWPNGSYRISHCPDLINAPNGVQAGRLEHFNLKRWQGDHNPYNATYGTRTSIFYTQDGDIYTRYQESGAKAVIDGGSITVDTGWRKITQSERGLISNSATFTIDITKRNASWYCPFKFTYMYGTTLCEIDFALSSTLSYTTKGPTYLDSITYTIDGKNIKIGIKFTTAMYGTQIVSFPSECGTINALTKDEFTGATKATYNGGYVLKSYMTIAELGLDTTATIDNILANMVNNSMYIYKTDAFNYATYYLGLQYATVSITKHSANRIQILMTDKDTGDLYVGKFNANNTFAGWTKVCTDSTPTVTTVTLPSGITGTVKYCVKNGICYVGVRDLKSTGTTTTITLTVPKALLTVSHQFGQLGGTSITGALYIEENKNLLLISTPTAPSSINFSYPVA